MDFLNSNAALISGFIGALIGASASILTVLIQAHYQARRERVDLITRLASEDYGRQIELAKASGKRFEILPLSVYLHYHMGIAKLLEKDTFTAEDLKRLKEESEKIIKALE